MTARILVVDDAPLNRRVLEAYLAAEYYDVIGASDGPSALSSLRATPPDIVLLDVMMPGITGFEVCERIKASPDSSHIPVVMVTALDSPEDRVRGLEAGADEFISKPVDKETLIARIRSLVRLKRLIDEWRMRERTSGDLGGPLDARAMNEIPGEPGAVAAALAAGTVLDALSRVCGNAGHRLVRLDPGATALDVAGVSPDVVVGFVEDPVFDALRLCSMLRSEETTRHLPFLTTGYADARMQLLKSLDLGGNDYIEAPLDPNELRVRLGTLIRWHRFHESLREKHRASIVMAVTDGLTGLYNRHFLDTHLERLFERACTERRPMSVILLDLDHFKAVNDAHGHAVGDSILRQLAERVRGTVRESSMVARLGGEEIVVLLPDGDIELASTVAERIAEAIRAYPFEAEGAAGPIMLTASLGVAERLESDTAPDAMLARADAAMYEAKRAGRNQVSAPSRYDDRAST